MSRVAQRLHDALQARPLREYIEAELAACGVSPAGALVRPESDPPEYIAMMSSCIAARAPGCAPLSTLKTKLDLECRCTQAELVLRVVDRVLTRAAAASSGPGAPSGTGPGASGGAAAAGASSSVAAAAAVANHNRSTSTTVGGGGTTGGTTGGASFAQQYATDSVIHYGHRKWRAGSNNSIGLGEVWW